MILVASIPFMSIAQKRPKKSNEKSNAKMGKHVKKSPSEYQYLIIEGYQSTVSDEEKMMGQDELAARDGAPGDRKMKVKSKSSHKHFVRFYTGKITAEQKELDKFSNACAHMSDALYQASELGWEFINASHVNSEDFIIHYYYLKRKKDWK